MPGVGELLFDVHDQSGDRFLGCNIISMDDIGSEKTRVLPLKSRKMEISENFTGAIEVQVFYKIVFIEHIANYHNLPVKIDDYLFYFHASKFTFLDEKEFKSHEITEKVSPNGNLIKTTRTVFTKPPDANSEAFTENVIKEFERNVVPNAEKSTLIIHAVQRVSVNVILTKKIFHLIKN